MKINHGLLIISMMIITFLAVGAVSASENVSDVIETADFDKKCLVVIHGYHGGTVIKNLVRKEFKHDLIAEKVDLDAGRTIFMLKR